MASANDDTTPRPSMDSFAPKSPTFSGYTFSDQASSANARGRRSSAASSVFSLNSIPDHRPQKDLRNHAIASLLDNTTSRSNIPKPTTRDIPPVVLTNITKVAYTEFAPYLSIAPDYERYRRAKEHEWEEALRRPRTPETPLNDTDPFKAAFSRSPDSRKTSLVPSTPPIVRPHSSDGGGSRKSSLRKQSVAIPPLNTVPQIYFDENFHLENPRTFDVVSERSHVIQSPIQENGPDAHFQVGRKALATNAILQEKLSWYMDIVEVHLIKEISSASSGFFAALGDLRELHAEADASVKKIQSLRAELDRLDRDQALAGLEVVRLRRRKANVQKLVYSIEQIAHSIKKLGEVEECLERNDIVAAIDTIEAIESLLEGRSPCGLTTPIIDLRSVKAVSAIQVDLTNLRARCGKALENRFVDTLLSDLRKHADTVPPSDTLLRFFQAYQRQQARSALRVDAMPSPRPVSMDYSQLPDSLRALLLDHLDGLRRANHVEKAVQAYREAVLKETKAIIRRNMPSDDDAASNLSGISRATGMGRTAAEKSSSLAKALRALGPREAEDLLVRIYTAISETLRRLGTQQKLLLDVTSGIDSILSPRNFVTSPNDMSSPPPVNQNMDSFYSVYSMDISELINAAIDAAQIQMVKVLKVRNEQTARLPLGDFLRYFMLNKLFSAECEGLSGKITTNLQGVIGAQIKDFISNFHSDGITQLATTIEKDQWEAKDFKPSAKASLERVLEAATKDAEIWLAWGRIYEDPPIPEDAADDQLPSGKIRTAMIDEQRFILPESGLAVLRLLETYECLMTMIPVSVADVAGSMLEFLKLFNSRVCQVILGAGATKSAGLKHITTKHLALASQALSIVVAVIPYVREAVRRHLGPASSGSTILPDFDRIKRNYQEHQSEIHSKLISIMSDRLMAHVRNVRQNIDWDGPGSLEQGKVNPYMETLVKETSTLHKVLSKHLSEDVLGSIMGPVFSIYKKRLGEAYGGVVLKTEVGKGRMLRDAQFFKDKMAKLDGSGDAGDEILKIVTEKNISKSGADTPRSIVNITTTTTATNTTATPVTNAANADQAATPEGEKKDAAGESKAADKKDGTQ